MAGTVIYTTSFEKRDEYATFEEACAVAVETAAAEGVKAIVTGGPGHTYMIAATKVADES